MLLSIQLVIHASFFVPVNNFNKYKEQVYYKLPEKFCYQCEQVVTSHAKIHKALNVISFDGQKEVIDQSEIKFNCGAGGQREIKPYYGVLLCCCQVERSEALPD